MLVKIEIDTDNILEYTSREEDGKIADSFLDKATDDALVNEVVSRNLFEEILDKATPTERERLFDQYFIQ